ncbi:MAG: hypothetical protein KJ630_19180 [Proteobacteria bacterium]|nr:hypothetical protein [Pseudomonadota bacterium]
MPWEEKHVTLGALVFTIGLSLVGLVSSAVSIRSRVATLEEWKKKEEKKDSLVDEKLSILDSKIEGYRDEIMSRLDKRINNIAQEFKDSHGDPKFVSWPRFVTARTDCQKTISIQLQHLIDSDIKTSETVKVMAEQIGSMSTALAVLSAAERRGRAD